MLFITFLNDNPRKMVITTPTSVVCVHYPIFILADFKLEKGLFNFSLLGRQAFVGTTSKKVYKLCTEDQYITRSC